MKYKPLPTLFYPYFERKNWKVCWKLNDGTWQQRDYISLHEVILMRSYFDLFQASDLRAMPRSARKIPSFLLNLFSKRLTDRSFELSTK